MISVMKKGLGFPRLAPSRVGSRARAGAAFRIAEIFPLFPRPMALASSMKSGAAKAEPQDIQRRPGREHPVAPPVPSKKESFHLGRNAGPRQADEDASDGLLLCAPVRPGHPGHAQGVVAI